VCIVARWIVFAIFGGFGLVLLYVGVTQFVQQRRLLTRARPVDAVITMSEVFSSTDKDRDGSRTTSTTTHRPDVKFKYVVAGREYESERLYPTTITRTYASREAAAEELRAFPVGATVQAHVCDGDPDKAYLVAEAGTGPLVFMIVGLLVPPVAWFASRLV
jgi:hypothetical protein